MKIDIIVIAYNQSENINNFYEKLSSELKGIKYKIVFVDNGSTDNTFNEIKKLCSKNEANVKTILLSKKYNANNAIVSAMNYTTNDYVCVYDFSYPINYIKKALTCINENNYDCICYCKRFKEVNIFKKQMTKLINKLLNINIINDKTNCRIFNRNMINSILKFSKDNIIKFDTFDNLGFNIYYDKLKSNDLNEYKIVIPKNLKLPLIGMLLGISLSIISILFIILTFIFTKITISLIFIFLFLLFSGINFIYIGVLSRNIIQYINKDEANYIIKEKYGFDENVL